MDKSKTAAESFAGGHLCSQSVLGVFCDELGLERETALKLALGFGGGFARCGESCGAVTGALMVIGLKEGTAQPGDSPEKAAVYKTVRSFVETFKNTHGSILCRELLQCDISTPEGHARARDAQLFDTVCPVLVESAVSTLEALFEKWEEGSSDV